MPKHETKTSNKKTRKQIREILDERQASVLTGFSKKHLQNLRYQSKGPAYSKIGPSIRYLRTDLMSWIASHRVDGGDQ